jgi:mono/diheme cytochrome c family protein
MFAPTIRQRPLSRARLGSIVTLAAIASIAWVACARAATDDDKIAAGEQVYNTYCATCHGDDLVNGGQTFDLRSLHADERPRFEHSVLNGKNQMPPWKGVLNGEQIDQLWHYIRAHAYQK